MQTIIILKANSLKAFSDPAGQVHCPAMLEGTLGTCIMNTSLSTEYTKSL